MKCGCDLENKEAVSLLQLKGISPDSLPEDASEPVLCSACFQEWASVAPVRPPYQTCDGCGVSVASDQIKERSKNECISGGLVTLKRSVRLSLCPKCTKLFDRTGRSVVIAVCILVGGIAVLALLGWMGG
jgi:hypothetical protein